MPDRPAASGELTLWSDLGADVLAEHRARASQAAGWAAAARVTPGGDVRRIAARDDRPGVPGADRLSGRAP